MGVTIMGAVAPKTPGICRNFTMDGIRQQRWSKLFTEPGITPVSLQEIRAPILKQGG